MERLRTIFAPSRCPLKMQLGPKTKSAQTRSLRAQTSNHWTNALVISSRQSAPPTYARSCRNIYISQLHFHYPVRNDLALAVRLTGDVLFTSRTFFVKQPSSLRCRMRTSVSRGFSPLCRVSLQPPLIKDFPPHEAEVNGKIFTPTPLRPVKPPEATEAEQQRLKPMSLKPPEAADVVNMNAVEEEQDEEVLCFHF